MNTYYLKKFRKKAKRKYRIQRTLEGYVVEYRFPICCWMYESRWLTLELAIEDCKRLRREAVISQVYNIRNRKLRKL